MAGDPQNDREKSVENDGRAESWALEARGAQWAADSLAKKSNTSKVVLLLVGFVFLIAAVSGTVIFLAVKIIGHAVVADQPLEAVGGGGVPAEVQARHLPEKDVPTDLWNLPYEDERITAVFHDMAEIRRLNRPIQMNVSNFAINAMPGFRLNSNFKDFKGPVNQSLMNPGEFTRVVITTIHGGSNDATQVNVEYASPVDLSAIATRYQFEKGELNKVPYYWVFTERERFLMIQASPRTVIFYRHGKLKWEQEPADRDLDQITRQIVKPSPPPGLPGRMIKLASGYPKITLSKSRPNPNDKYSGEAYVIGASGMERYLIEAPADPGLLPEMNSLRPNRMDLRRENHSGWIDDRFHHIFVMYSSPIQF